MSYDPLVFGVFADFEEHSLLEVALLTGLNLSFVTEVVKWFVRAGVLRYGTSEMGCASFVLSCAMGGLH